MFTPTRLLVRYSEIPTLFFSEICINIHPVYFGYPKIPVFGAGPFWMSLLYLTKEVKLVAGISISSISWSPRQTSPARLLQGTVVSDTTERMGSVPRREGIGGKARVNLGEIVGLMYRGKFSLRNRHFE